MFKNSGSNEKTVKRTVINTMKASTPKTQERIEGTRSTSSSLKKSSTGKNHGAQSLGELVWEPKSSKESKLKAQQEELPNQTVESIKDKDKIVPIHIVSSNTKGNYQRRVSLFQGETTTTEEAKQSNDQLQQTLGLDMVQSQFLISKDDSLGSREAFDQYDRNHFEEDDSVPLRQKKMEGCFSTHNDEVPSSYFQNQLCESLYVEDDQPGFKTTIIEVVVNKTESEGPPQVNQHIVASLD